MKSAAKSATSSPARASAQPEATVAPPSKRQRQRDRERRKAREKLSRQIASLEAEIQTAESAVEAAGWKLAAPDLYKDVDRMRELAEEKTALEAAVTESYAAWERLADELAALDDLSS